MQYDTSRKRSQFSLQVLDWSPLQSAKLLFINILQHGLVYGNGTPIARCHTAVLTVNTERQMQRSSGI